MSFRIDKVNGQTWLWVDSKRLEECMAEWRKQRIYGLSIAAEGEYEADNVDFLRNYPDVRVLSLGVRPSVPFDLSGLRELADLRVLRCSIPFQLDATVHPLLEEFSGQWLESIDFGRFHELRKLSLWSFRPKSRDLLGLRVSDTLNELRLVKPRVDSLAGVERLAGLKSLGLYYLSKRISDYDRIASLSRLESLDLESCKGVVDYGFLRRLSALKKLMITKCSDLANVRFVDSMPHLAHFSFVDTIVSDGDLRPLLHIPYVGFTSRRSYSHTFEQFERRSKLPQ